MIAEMLNGQGRWVMPFCKENPQELGIGEIADFEKDTVPGVLRNTEPVERVRGNFFKSENSPSPHTLPGGGVRYLRRRLGHGGKAITTCS